MITILKYLFKINVKIAQFLPGCANFWAQLYHGLCVTVLTNYKKTKLSQYNSVLNIYSTLKNITDNPDRILQSISHEFRVHEFRRRNTLLWSTSNASFTTELDRRCERYNRRLLSVRFVPLIWVAYKHSNSLLWVLMWREKQLPHSWIYSLNIYVQVC